MLGKTLKLKGAITGGEDVYIDGDVEGTIELHDNALTIGPNGNVRADVRAREITVLGRLTGNVRAGDRVDIRKTGSLEGDLTTSRIAIEDGAVFRGSIDITKAAATTPAAANSVKKPAPSGTPASASSTAPESAEKAAAKAAKA